MSSAVSRGKRLQAKHQEINEMPALTLFLRMAPEQLEEQHGAASAGIVTCGTCMESLRWGLQSSRRKHLAQSRVNKHTSVNKLMYCSD